MSRGTRVPSQGSLNHFAYRAVAFYGPPFQAVSAIIQIFDFPKRLQPPQTRSHNPNQKTLAGLQLVGLGSSHFARRYFGNRICFLFLRVLRCFSSPRSPPYPIHSDMDIRALPRMGCPIRKSPGQSLFSGSPKLIAASHVLHRLLTPRHPPFALSSLAIIYKDSITTKTFSILYLLLKMPKNPYSFVKERSVKDFPSRSAFSRRSISLIGD